VQAERQVSDPGSHAYGRQSVEPATQLPAPSHASSTTYSFEHAGAPQVAPSGKPEHAPLPLQEPAQVALVPAQSPRGSSPAATAVQVPGVASQRRHEPLHAVEQHTPSTHQPEAHCPFSVQAAPAAESPTHCPPEQVAPGAQWFELLQLVRQALPALLHAYGLQEPVDWTHVPLPSQVWPLSVALTQVVLPQEMFVPGNPHAPAPLHEPPQVPAPAHSLFGSVPAAIAVHVPAVLREALQVWHSPRHASEQHTPSVHQPDWHSAPFAHDVPFAASRIHWLFTQTAPKTQSKLPLHEVRHVPP
jgi:hypothetical protein